MNHKIFSFLKQKNIFEIRTVDRLFVSTFLHINDLKTHNKFLNNFYIKKDDSDFYLFNEFLSILRNLNNNHFSIENLIELFEFVISPSDRIINGAIYTPPYIRKIIVENCFKGHNNNDLHCLRIADIACGCGGFLVDTALYLYNNTNLSFYDIFKKNIFGIDIQKYSVERTKIILSLLALINGENKDYDFNLLVADTLDYIFPHWNFIYSGFDIIVGNPPYVCSRHLDDTTKVKMKAYEVCQSGHPDLYISFFQIAVEMLNDRGKVGFITMNSFIRSMNGRNVRQYFSNGLHEIKIIDFRGYQIFKRRNTYTCLFFLTKNLCCNSIAYSVVNDGKIPCQPIYNLIPYNKLNNRNGWFINDFNNVSKIESTGITIGNFCQSRHGIATLSNKTFIFKPIKEDKDYYYLKKNEVIYPIEKKICRNIINPNHLNSSIKYVDILEKLIFPYYEKNGETHIIEEEILKSYFPKAYNYLTDNYDILLKRDKGKTDSYASWYAYGRTQSLQMPRYKLLVPKFANKKINCILIDDKQLMIYNGIVFISNDEYKLIFLKHILESELFWDYIVKNAKPYASGYFSLSGVDIKNFGIPILSENELISLLTIENENLLTKKLKNFYNK